LHEKKNSIELKNNVTLNNNRTTRVSKYLLESNHTSNYGYNNPLNRGIRIFNTRINCYEKNNTISLEIYKKKTKINVNVYFSFISRLKHKKTVICKDITRPCLV
jgi:hypothetical protein